VASSPVAAVAAAAMAAAAALAEHILETVVQGERALHAVGAMWLYCAAFVLRWLLLHPR